jgi:hypothetical protein
LISKHQIFHHQKEGDIWSFFDDILAPSMGEIVLKPMVSPITTTPNYPRGPLLDPALLSCIRADFPLLHSNECKRRKWAPRRKAGRESSRKPRGQLGTVIIEDINGNTTITRIMGTKISH